MRAAVVLIASTALTSLYAAANPRILYNDSDPLTYLNKAWFFLAFPAHFWLPALHSGGADVPSRGPGFPLFLILTGVAPFDSWAGLVVAHLAIAVLTPLVVYIAIRRFSPNAALISALLIMAAGIPWQMMNWVMTEHLFMFSELVAIALFAKVIKP